MRKVCPPPTYIAAFFSRPGGSPRKRRGSRAKASFFGFGFLLGGDSACVILPPNGEAHVSTIWLHATVARGEWFVLYFVLEGHPRYNRLPALGHRAVMSSESPANNFLLLLPFDHASTSLVCNGMVCVQHASLSDISRCSTAHVACLQVLCQEWMWFVDNSVRSYARTVLAKELICYGRCFSDRIVSSRLWTVKCRVSQTV